MHMTGKEKTLAARVVQEIRVRLWEACDGVSVMVGTGNTFDDTSNDSLDGFKTMSLQV
jgi:hypothetical protein